MVTGIIFSPVSVLVLLSFSLLSTVLLLGIVVKMTEDEVSFSGEDISKKNKKIYFCTGVGVIVSIAAYLLLAAVPQHEFFRWVMGLAAGVLSAIFALWTITWWPFVWDRFKESARW